MRLMKVQQKGKKLYRVVLCTQNNAANYVEVTTGTVFDKQSYEHMCVKCLEVINWQEWTNLTHAKNTCKCGEKATLSLVNLADGFAEYIEMPHDAV